MGCGDQRQTLLVCLRSYRAVGPKQKMRTSILDFSLLKSNLHICHEVERFFEFQNASQNTLKFIAVFIPEFTFPDYIKKALKFAAKMDYKILLYGMSESWLKALRSRLQTYSTKGIDVHFIWISNLQHLAVLRKRAVSEISLW